MGPCDVLPGFRCPRVIQSASAMPATTSIGEFGYAQSPCVRNCCLGDDLTCLGCFRSLDEIKEWGLVDDERRREILQNAEQRRAAYQMAAEER